MDTYMFLSSDDSDDIFMDNKPYDFTTQIPFFMNMDSSWEIALAQITIEGIPDESLRQLFVCSNLVEESIVGCSQLRILRRILLNQSSTSRENEIFISPFFIPVCLRSSNLVRIYITTRNGDPALFLSKPVSVTLHFRRLGLL